MSENPQEASKIYENFDRMYNFYHREYAPLIAKARTSMGTFFVMDNIKELGSIRLIDKNRRAFWLMKWATGKTGEYVFDMASAFEKYPKNAKGMLEAIMNEPIFKRVFNEFAVWAKMAWIAERMTNHEFTWTDWVKATVVPFAAMNMLFGEAIYKYFIKNNLSDDASISNAVAGMTSFVSDQLVNRAFIYAGILASDLASPLKTASSVDWGFENMVDTFVKAYWKKFWTWPITNHTKLNSSWYRTEAGDLFNTSTQIAEILFNQNSTVRENWNDTIQAIYNIWGGSGFDSIGKFIPVIKNISTAGVDIGVLYDKLEDAAEKTNVKGFLRASTSKTELLRLIWDLEKNSVKNNEKYLERVETHKEFIWDDDKLLEAGIRSWAWTPDMETFKTVIKGLNKQDDYWKDQLAMWRSTLSEQELATLKTQFIDMYNTYAKDEGATTAMFDKFVIAATKFWGSMSMAWYMQAFSNAYKSAVAKSLGLKSKEVAAWKKGDEWLTDTEIDFSDVPDTKFWDYVRYVEESRKMQTKLILDNRDIISWEKNIWQALVNKYIETDTENFSFWSYSSNISQDKSNLAKLWNIKMLDWIQKEQGMAWLIVPLAYQERKASDNFVQATKKAGSVEEAWEIAKKFLSIQESMGKLADKFFDNPIAAWLVKVSLANGISSYADEIEEASPWMLAKVKDIVWEKYFNSVLNSLTDSPAVTLADAFELATNISAHQGSGKKWRGFSLPDAKVLKNYVDKMMIPRFNKASTMWKGWGGTSSVNLPKFATQYGRNKETGSIGSTKIPIAKAWKLTRSPEQSGISTKTAKLEVRTLPVEEWRIIWWKYTARAIKGAKVYTRNLKR